MNDTSHGSHVVMLSRLKRADRLMAGGKASHLGELLEAGFQVPEGFVLTAAAFSRFLEFNGLGASSTPQQVAQAQLPAEVAAALQEAARALGEGALAVRSSAVAEDLPGASYAGQYETLLGVNGLETLGDAVRKCWASAFNERTLSYRLRQGLPQTQGMAVLVQRMVRADAAGVAFTANPVTGDRGEALVSAVRGLGERLVSGHASPDEWRVRDQQAQCVRAPEQCIEVAQVLEIAALARRVEAHFGVPQDIEWAISDGRLFLLQARPITTLAREAVSPVPVKVEPPEGFWQRDATHFPRPLSPLYRSIGPPAVNSAFRKAFRAAGILAEGIELREIGGWLYTRMVPLGGKDRPPPPRWALPLLSLLWRIIPPLRERIHVSIDAIRTDRFGEWIRDWEQQTRSRLEARAAQLREVELSALPDTELDAHLGQVLAFFAEAHDLHFLLVGASSIPIADLAFTCRDLLGWDEQTMVELVSGLSAKSTEPSRKLAKLAEMARERPGVRALLEQRPDPGTLQRLRAVDPEFVEHFERHQKIYGCRALRYELSDPTFAELPELVLGFLHEQLVRGYDPRTEVAELEQRRAARASEARALLAQRPAAERERFERALSAAERGYPVREDNEFYTMSVPLALVRYVVLEVGRRLHRRGVIDQPEDLFFLEVDELRAALREGRQVRELVTRRRGERAWVEAHEGPASYGRDPGPPPSVDWLPDEARFAMEAVLWVTDRAIGAQRQADAVTGGVLRGIAASPGEYTGTVCVIQDESQFGKLRAGDVLVCPITSPVWSVLFPNVGALVTDTGGVLSHSAIIAREYALPAVVATGNATQMLKDGQRVIVDGKRGEVRPLA